MTVQVIERSYNCNHFRDTFKGSYPFVKPYPYVRHIENERHGRFIRQHPSYKPAKAGTVDPFTPFPREHSLAMNKLSGNRRNLVHNKALSNLQAELTIASNLFESWYERREAYAMLGGALSETLRFARNWRNPKYYASLGKKAKTPSSLPEAWLMYNFGVKPLVGTVDTMLHSLAQPIPYAPFSGTSSTSFTGKSNPGEKECFLDRELWYEGTYLKKIGCTAVPNPNPNVGLTNIAGLTTPFSTAWSVVPWGWAVDYFVNVSELLSNVELVHPGVKTMDWYETVITTHKHHGSLYALRGYPSKKVNYLMYDGDGYRMVRKTITPPRFKLAFDFPLLGSSKVANISSALALTLKGRKS